MNKVLLMATALALPLIASSAEAADPYVAVRAGYGWTKTDVKRGDLKDYAPVIGAAIGTNIDRNVRVEAEYNYRFESDDKIKGAKAEMTAHTLMLNGYYDFHNSSKFTPYVGVGVGGAYWDAETKLSGRKVYDKDGWSWAAGAIGGISYELTSNVNLDLSAKYTYIDAADGSHNVDALLGVRYKF